MDILDFSLVKPGIYTTTIRSTVVAYSKSLNMYMPKMECTLVIEVIQETSKLWSAKCRCYKGSLIIWDDYLFFNVYATKTRAFYEVISQMKQFDRYGYIFLDK